MQIVHIGGRGLCNISQAAAATTTEAAGKAASQLNVPGEQAHLPRRVLDFYRSAAPKIMLPIVYEYSQQLGVKFKDVRFKDTRSRWGSASSAGNLSFSWRIIMAPIEVVRYLVAHEVAHLRHMNHSKVFWQTCGELCPKWHEYSKWLKRHESEFMKIDFSS